MAAKLEFSKGGLVAALPRWKSVGLAPLVIAVLLAFGDPVHAEEPASALTFAPWDVEQYKTGSVALTRADDRRTAILIFCTLVGTKSVVYAYDGRGQNSEDIPISQVRVLKTPTIDVFGHSLPSSAATFDNDGYIVRMQLPLPADFEPPQSGEMTLASGPEAAAESRWSITIGKAGIEDAVRIAFKNCV